LIVISVKPGWLRTRDGIESWFDSLQRQMTSFSNGQTGCGVRPMSYSIGTEAICPAVKRLEDGSYHSQYICPG